MSGKKEFGRAAPGIATRSELEARIKARPKPKLERHLTIIRITPEERNALEKQAAGVTLSTYIRSRLFGESVSPRRTRGKAPVKDQHTLAHVLSKLGQSRLASNINQLAKAANIGSLPVTPETEKALQTACRDIRAIKQMIMKALGIQEG